MSLEDRGAQHDKVVVDKYHDPYADYQMTTRDYVLRPYVVAAAITITLPSVAEAKGRFYSIIARTVSMTLTITITSKGDDEGWEGDIVLFETGQGTLLYSDGLKWMMRTWADIEVGSTTRGQYNKAAVSIAGMTARGGRFRAETRSAAALTVVNADGVHAQGVSYADLYGGTVNALYAEAVAKTGTSVTTLRGAMIACDSEGTPTLITNMYGAHIRVKTSVQPAAIYRCLGLEHEEFGAGTLLTEYIKIFDTTFGATDVTATYGLRMLTTGIITNGISLESPMVNGLVISGYCSTLCLDIDKTSSIATATGVRAAEITMTMDTTSNVNQLEVLKVELITGDNVKTGAWANAIMAKLDYGNSGHAHGLASCFCAELSMPGAAVVRGHYAFLECEMDCPTSCTMGGNPISLIYLDSWGAAKAQFDDVGLVFDFNGVTSGATDFFYANAVAFNNCDAFLKVSINDVEYYIPLSDNQAGT